MLSYQLYSSRNFPPLQSTLTMLAEAGLLAVEGFGGLYSDDATVDAMEAGLRAAGLTMPTAHFGLDMIEASPDKVITIAKRLGIRRIYCPWVHPDQRGTDGPSWRAFGARLQKAGAPIRDADLGFGWHNHDFEFRRTADGALPQEEIFRGGPDLEWEMDVAWVVRGGADPFEWIEKEKSRITAAHVKDIAPAGENLDQDGWSDVGAGTVPWARLMPALRAIGVQHFVLEHDNPKDDAAFARASVTAVKGY
jgi:sugar phosphate isomerase/epimerase